MIALTNKYMNKLDKIIINDYNIPSLVLIENAALRVFEVLKKFFNLKKETINIFCGNGNNGADGLALARILYINNFSFNIFISKDWQKASLDFKREKKILDNFGFSYYFFDNKKIINEKKATIYVDALFGTGFKEPLKKEYEELINLLNKQNGFKLSIDISSGINGTTGKGNIYFQSDLIVTFAYPKWAHLLRDDLGEIFIGNISFDPNINIKGEHVIYYMNIIEAKKILCNRKKNTHKGTYGHLGIIGGDITMIGASLLAGKAALKMGVGLVTLFTTENIAQSILGKELEIILETKNNMIEKNIKTLIIGPGMKDNLPDNLKCNLLSFSGSILIDAGGLALLKKNILKREWIKGDLILTPHPKEMAFLMNITTEKVNSNRIAVAKLCSKKFNCITVLKGSRTIITDGTKVFINLTGNPGMATAGSGDVLSGIIASLLAQKKHNIFHLVVLGVFIHGLSGDLANKKIDENSLIASDLICFLNKTIKKIKKIKFKNTFLKRIKE